MKTRYLLASITAALFTVSHLLPAFNDDTGFICFRYCLDVLIDFKSNELAGWLYYGGFALSNFAFVAFAALAFTRKGFSLKSIIILSVLSLHVLSWPLISLYYNPKNITDIKVGYYLWLSAYLLLTYVSIRYRNKITHPNRDPEPANEPFAS